MNLWHTCPKGYAERFPWNAAFTAVPFFSFAQPASLYCERICEHVHICDCLAFVYELPLLPNNTASETFLHNSGSGWKC